STDRTESRRSLLAPIVLGGLAFVAFLGASLVARHVPGLDGAVDSALATADAGPTVLVLTIAVVNAVAEERFFRGALPVALVGDHRAVVATAVYVLVTVATLNVALVVAAAAMGTVFMLERLATRGILAATLTHVTWSTLMLLAIPRCATLSPDRCRRSAPAGSFSGRGRAGSCHGLAGTSIPNGQPALTRANGRAGRASNP